MANFFKEDTQRIILCRGIKYGIAHIPLSECVACEHHGGIDEIKPAQNDLPPVEVIICKLPVTVRINYFVKGVEGKGKAPIKEGRR